MQAVRTVMTAAKGRQYVGMIQNAPAGMHAMRFEGPADVLFIVWNDQSGKRQKVRYTKKNLLSVAGLMGDAVELKADHSSEAQVKIDEAAGPIYLFWKRVPGYAMHNAITGTVHMARPVGQ
jgi:hypothetical protein